MVKDAPKKRKSEKKKGIKSNKDKTKINISFWVLEKESEQKRIREKKREEKKKEGKKKKKKIREERRKGKRRSQVWNYEYLYGNYGCMECYDFV